MTAQEPDRCPDCGAAWQGDLTCQAVFDQFLVLEFTDPEYGAVHMLTVACYMIQHGKYSDEGLAWIETQLRDHLENGVTADQIRRRASGETGQDRRSWNVTRRPSDPPQREIAWSMTIVDVARNYHDAASYRESITQWARTTLAEMQPLVRS